MRGGEKGQYTIDDAITDLQPFSEVARGVPDNQRKPLVEVGGLKCQSHAGRLHIDA
jgi:hypothetical protein